MKTGIREHAQRLAAGHEDRLWYLRALVVIALLVCAGVAATLVQSAIALNRVERVLACPYAGDGAHTHDASCYDAEGNLVCPLVERPLHTHDDSCYTTSRTLVCGLEDDPDHVHTDACYEVTRTLTCGLAETTERHVHGPGCFVTVAEVGPDDTGEAACLRKAAVSQGEELPAQSFAQEVRDATGTVRLQVAAEASEGALPAGTTMQARWIEPDDLPAADRTALEDAVARDDDACIVDLQAVDITFRDADGAEVEPQAKIVVTFSSPLVQDAARPMVLHVRETDEARHALPAPKAEVMEALDGKALTAHHLSLDADELAIEADAFSIYALVSVREGGEVDATDATDATDAADAADDGATAPAEPTSAESAQAPGPAQAPRRALSNDTTTDIAEMLVELYLNGELVEDGARVAVHPDETFQVGIVFKETAGEGGRQFVDDDTPMTYTLPDGLRITGVPADGSLGEVSITVRDMGRLYTITGNTVTYDADTNTVRLVLNHEHPSFDHLKASENAEVELHLTCEFTEPAGHTVRLNGDYNITLANPSDVRVSKEATYGSYPVGPDGASRTLVRYEVEVAADGDIVNPVNVTDAIAGAALTLSDIPISCELAGTDVTDRVTITPAADKKGFTAVLPANGDSTPCMTDGQALRFVYYAEVDTSKLGASGQTTFEEAGNTVTVDNGDNPTDNPKNNTAEATPLIDFYDIRKECTVGELVPGTDVGGTDDDDRMYRKLTWTVWANEEHQITFASGETIDDWLSYDKVSEILSFYAGEGITVTRFDEQGQEQETRTYTWQEAGAQRGKGTYDGSTSVTANDKDTPLWSWPVMQGGKDSYQITYSTYVDVGAMSRWNTLYNHASNTHIGATTVDVEVGPTGDGDNIPLRKTLLTSDSEHAEWQIEVDARPEGYDEREGMGFQITDVIPYKWINNTLYKDTLVSWEVTGGLQEGESYEGALHKNRWAADRLKIEFYKTDESGQRVKGLAPSRSGEMRTITLKVVTEHNQKWIDLATPSTNNAGWLREHANRGEVRAEHHYYGTDTAKITLSKRNISKALARAHDETPKDESDRTTTIDGVEYPLYYFHVILTGFEGNDGKDLVIEDDFNLGGDHHMTFAPWQSIQVDFSDSPYWGNNDENYTMMRSGTLSPSDYLTGTPTAEKFSVERTDKGFRLTIPAENIPTRKGGGGYYGTIHLYYYLMPAGPEGLAALKQDAGANLGRVTYVNAVKAGGLDWVSAPYSYAYNPISKTQVSDETSQTIAYTVTLNSAAARLNGGEPIEAADTHSENLSIDYTSIKVAQALDADGKDRTDDVSWDYRGNTGTFVIPDETAVTITYVARVIDAVSADTPATNSIEMLGFRQTASDETFVFESKSTADVFGLYLYKYADGHMESGLDGARFRLLDENRVPMTYLKDGVEDGDAHQAGDEIIFTTDSLELDEGAEAQGGYARIRLENHRHGIALRKDTVYYLEEIQAPVTGAGTADELHYKPDLVLYSFVISDNPNYTAPGGAYVYGSGDVLKIRNTPDVGGFYLAKRFGGNVAAPQGVRDTLAFSVYAAKTLVGGGYETDAEGNTVYEDTPVEVEVGGTKRTVLALADLTTDALGNGSVWVSALAPGRYKVVEQGAEPTGGEIQFMSRNFVDGQERVVAEFDVTKDDIDRGVSHTVAITNTYYENSFSFTKIDADSKAALRGAEFSAYAASDAATPYATYVTGGVQGRFVVKRAINANKSYHENTLYYIVETKAPEGYKLPADETKLERTYFYFSAPVDDGQDRWTPGAADGLPEGAHATDLTTGYGSVTLENASDSKVSVTANKAWANVDGTTGAPTGATVTFTLYRNGEPLGEAYDVELDGVADDHGDDAFFAHAETAAWHAEWTGLPKLDENNAPYAYTIVEKTGWAGYAADKASIASGKVITNVQESATVTFDKRWYGPEGVLGAVRSWPDDTELDVTLTRALVGADGTRVDDEDFSIVYTIGAGGAVTATKKAPVGAAGTIRRTTGAASAVYAYEVSGLDRYGELAGVQGTWEYALAETAIRTGGADVTDSYVRASETASDGTMRLQNTPVEACDLTATKAWTAGIAQMQAVELTVFHKVDPKAPYLSADALWVGDELYDVMTKDALGAPLDPVVVSADDDWQHVFSNLPRKAGDASEKYLVRETALWAASKPYDPAHPSDGRINDVASYYAQDSGDPVEATQHAIAARVTNKPAEVSVQVSKEWAPGLSLPDDLRVTFALYRDGSPYAGADGNPVLVTLPVEDGTGAKAWSATVEGLPKYRDGQGDLTSSSWRAYEVAMSFTEDGHEVHLSQQQINARFAVRARNDGDGSFADGTGGCAVAIDGTAGAVTFRNEPPETMTLDVSKSWSAEFDALSDKAVTFTLYAGADPYVPSGASDPVTVTLPREGAQGSEAWQATIDDLPKYDFDGAPITWRLRETAVTVAGETVEGEAVAARYSAHAVDAVSGRETAGTSATATFGTTLGGADYNHGALAFTNSRARLTSVKVSKVWKDQKGNVIEDPSASDYARTFELWRTTATHRAVTGLVEGIYGLPNSPVLGNYVPVRSDTNSQPCNLTSDSVLSCLSGDTLVFSMQGKRDNNYQVQLSLKDWSSLMVVSTDKDSGTGYFREDGTLVNEVEVPDGCRAVRFNVWNGANSVVSITRKGKTARLVGTFAQAQHAQYVEALPQSEQVGTFTLSARDGWEWSDDALPLQDAEGNVYAYYVVEKGADAKTVYSYTDNADGTGMEATVENVMETTDVTVRKSWADGAEAHAGDTVTYDLYRTTSPVGEDLPGLTQAHIMGSASLKSAETDKVYVLSDGTTVNSGVTAPLLVYPGDKIQVSIEQLEGVVSMGPYVRYQKNGPGMNVGGNQKVSFDRMLLNGQEVALGSWYYKKLKNTDALIAEFTIQGDLIEKWPYLFFNLSLGDGKIGIVVTNLTHPNAGRLTRAELLQLVSSGAAEFVTSDSIAADGSWSSASALPKADAEGNAYHYFAVERAFGGYADAYVVTDNATTITNTPPEPGKTSFTFYKAWLPSSPDSLEPQEWQRDITVSLYRSGSEDPVGVYAIGVDETSALVATGRTGDPAATVERVGDVYGITVADLDEGSYYAVEDACTGFVTKYGTAGPTGALAVTDGQTRADAAHPYILNREEMGEESPILPMTGGVGTAWLYVLGAGLLLGGWALCLRRLGCTIRSRANGGSIHA